MGIKYELIASTGEYTTKTGETKKRWTKVGLVLENERGMSIKVEQIPVGWDGWAIMTEPREKPQSGGSDSDVPF